MVEIYSLCLLFMFLYLKLEKRGKEKLFSDAEFLYWEAYFISIFSIINSSEPTIEYYMSLKSTLRRDI